MADESLADLLRRIDAHPTIRPWSIHDADDLVAAWSDPEVARWNGVPPEPSLDLARRWTAGAAQQTAASRSIDVVSATDAGVRGEVGLVIDHERSLAEVGFWVGAAHRRAGVGVVLLDTATNVAAALGIDRAVAVTSSDNAPALALLTHCAWPEVATTTSDRRAFLAPVNAVA